MRILIGDSLFNQRFLAVAARRAGFTEIVGAASTDDLFEAAADADVIAFDPSIDRVDAELDVALHLLRLVPRTSLVVVSSRSAELERAEVNGIAAARKRSILDLDAIVTAMAFVQDQVRSQRAPPPALTLESPLAPIECEQISTGPSANASLVAVSVGSTW